MVCAYGVRNVVCLVVKVTNTPDAEHNDVINFDNARFRKLIDAWKSGKATMNDIRRAAGLVDVDAVEQILFEDFAERRIASHRTDVVNHISQDEYVPARLKGETLTVSAPIQNWLYCPFCGEDFDFHYSRPIEEWTLEDWAEFYAGYHEGYDEEL